ncbi:hypothetical protein PV797_02880 [Clostridiaceae bacterium M8S5]|nr:hypothetical protein PV797_02880 [Clostridiaceae bacterium M8S5]
MDKKTIDKIKDKNLDIEYFASRTIKEPVFRDQVFEQMISNIDIMVYYHCYYIVQKASSHRPDLFYKYWDQIVLLLSHKNSYHRDFGLSIIANLVVVDSEKKFDNIIYEYLDILKDEKFMTSQCLVRNLANVLEYRDDLKEIIIPVLLNIDNITPYTRKQVDLLKSDILDIFDKTYTKEELTSTIIEFIEQAKVSVSPKTRKKSNKLMKKFDL